MFRAKRADTRVETIEQKYGIELNARGDMLLGNLLAERGFKSQSQLLKAYRGNLTSPARKRRIFLSFHYEDRQQVEGLSLMAMNPNIDFDFNNASVRTPINSSNSSYIRREIRSKIERASVLVCLIGNGTAWREWVDWEIRTAYELRKGVCGVRLKDSRGQRPPALKERNAPVVQWSVENIIAVIERAAARRS